MNRAFSLARIYAVLLKEFLQMRRDRITLGMIVGVPLAQLLLFGFAINFNPKALPTAVSVADPGVFARSVVAALRNSSYFEIVAETNSPAAARRLLQEGKALFVVEIPVNFTRDIARGARPDLLVEADATDPAASGFALGAFDGLAANALRDDLTGPLAARAQGPPPFNTVRHLLYNPESNTRYSII
ncbi:MAG: ABC transporter permease, partial [Alphaproteobacteria bacterium]|nr:ABC transporter permease [Alphaproteobacteria bacterium]